MIISKNKRLQNIVLLVCCDNGDDDKIERSTFHEGTTDWRTKLRNVIGDDGKVRKVIRDDGKV